MRRIALVAALLVAACGSGSSPTVTVHDVRITAAIAPPVVAVGGTLIARTDHGISRSSDGRTWHDVELPGSPPEATVAYTSPEVSDGLALVAAHDVGVGSMVWASGDGRTWSGGPVIARTTEPAAIGSVNGVLVAAAVTLERTLEVRVSTDRGRTWHAAPTDAIAVPAGGGMRATAVRPDGDGLAVEVVVADEHNIPTQTVIIHTDDGRRWTRTTCPETTCSARLGGNALVRQREVSLDQGATWKPFRLVPVPPAKQDAPSPLAAVDAGDGRYLGTAQSYVPSDVSFGYLAAKDPGSDEWRQLVGRDPCAGKVGTRPNSAFSLPVRLGQVWFASSSCSDLSAPVDAVVVSGKPTDATFEPVAATRRRHLAFAQPLLVHDEIVVPEVDDRYRVVGLLTLDAAD